MALDTELLDNKAPTLKRKKKVNKSCICNNTQEIFGKKINFPFTTAP